MLRISRFPVSRFLTGLVAFAGSGILIGQMLTDNGSARIDQAFWENADTKTIRVSKADRRREMPNTRKTVEEILTASVKPAVGPTVRPAVRDALEEAVSQLTQEPSVLSLIRENQDIAPAVSSGTDRVSVTVRAGDTLFSIARRHGLKLSEIAQLNGLKAPYVIRAGQTLYVAR